MFHSLFRRLVVAITCVLFLTMSLALTMSSQVAIAQPDTPSVTVQKVWTGDSNNKAQTAFAPGNTIHYLVQVNSTYSTTVTATFTFLATGPKQIFSLTASAPVAPGTEGFYSPSTVPSTAPAGTYSLKVTVTYKGMSSAKQSPFTVALVHKTDIWAGYAAVASTNNQITFTSIVGQWNVPSVSCSAHENSQSAAWIGLGAFLPGGNQLGNYIAQLGTESNCENGTSKYYAVYEMYDRTNPPGVTTLFSISAGDGVTAYVYYIGNGTYQLGIGSPNGWSWYSNEQGSGQNAARNSAEWIVEQPGGVSLLSHFSPVNFYGCYANSNPINGNPITVQLIMQPTNSTPKATPSPLYPPNTSFSVTRQGP